MIHTSRRYVLMAAVLLGGALLRPEAARAAESYDNCVGFIDSVPATISTQGVWCLRHDLGTAISSGYAIVIDTNNVTIDCNDFKLGGLAAGSASSAYGIYAYARQNVTVRHCNVRGFEYGISLGSGAGYVVEDSVLNQNLVAGLYVGGENNLVQRNRIYDTGGKPGSGASFGIVAQANVIDNAVSGVYATQSSATVHGIESSGGAALIRGNHVSGLSQPASGTIRGISASGPSSRVSDNHVAQQAASTGVGILSTGANSFCIGNTVANYSDPYDSCAASAGNLQLP